MTTDTATEVVIPDTGSTQVSTREVPWIKLGKIAEQPMTAAEAAELGGLNFDVETRPLGYEKDGKWITIGNRKAVVNMNTGAPLGIVSKMYPILQYAQAFDFMDAVAPTYVAAGALKGGKQGFMVVRAPEETSAALNAIDPHDFFLVLRTSHDCSRAVEVSCMSLRGRCMNQLTLRSFAAGVPWRWTVKHTTTMHAKLAEAQHSLANLGAYNAAFIKNVEKLIHVKVDDKRAIETLKFVLPDRPRRDEQIDRITSAWHNSETVGFDWTGWGLVNAVSEYFDWGRAGGSPESRFIGALQGSTHKAINTTARYLLTT